MKKLFTKQLFRVFTLLTLMLTTAFVANATFWVRGSFDMTGNEWNAGVAMTETSSNIFTVDITTTEAISFKLYNDYGTGTWWGYSGDYGTASSLPWSFPGLDEGGGGNMSISVAGTIRFTLNTTSHQLDVAYVSSPRTVAVASEIADYVEVDKTEASAGETVTITVTPPSGKWADKTNILAYATIPPSSKDNAPEMGVQLTIAGDAIATNDAPGEYTFTMPEYPKGAYVSNVEFQNCTELTAEMFEAIGNQEWTGSQITPTVTPISPLTSDDYDITYGPNTDEGTGTVTVTGKGQYTGSVTLTFTIAKAAHAITVDPNTANGTITIKVNDEVVTEATEGTTITLSSEPNNGYELDHYTITYNGTSTDLEGNTFTMPNYPVTVTATFTKLPQLYIATHVEGGSSEWPKTAMTQQADGSWVIEMTSETELHFTFYDQDDHYYGSETQDGEYWINATNIGQPLPISSHNPFIIKQAGTWTITVNPELTTVTVTGDWYFDITTAVAVENTGTLTADLTTAKAGDKVTLTVAPATDYEFSSLVVTYGDNQTITPTLKEGETNIYEFTMPASDVTVTATFTKIPTLDLRYNIDYTAPNNWSNKAFELQQDGTWKLEMTTAAPLAFGLLDENETWYGSTQEGGWYDITKAMIGTAQTLGTNERFYLPVAGKWTFTVNADRTTITITGDWDYAITINAEGCTVVTDPAERASAMETVTVTATPTMENSTGVITVVDADNNPVEFDATNNTFVMPYSAVTITATYTVQKFAITLGTSDNYTLTTDQADNTQVAVGAEVTVTVTPTNTADFVPAGLVTDPALQSTITDNGDGTYTFTMPANAINITATLNAILHGVLFDANHRWATYFGAYNLVAPTGVEVYVVGADYALGNEVPVTKINYIPENKGVLLYCPNDMSDITTPLVAEEDLESDIPATALVGSVEPMTLAAYENYVLYNDVFLLAEAGTLPAHRCYLPKPAGNSKMRLTLNRPGEGGVITAIEGIDAENVANVKYVNLSGMTSDKPFSGINIMVITRTDGTVETMKVVR